MSEPTPTSSQLAELGQQAYVLRPEHLLIDGRFATGHALGVGADGIIASVGPAEDVTRAFRQAEVIDLPGRAVLPGFIDAHHHLTQAFAGPLAFGEPSEIFRRVWQPLETALTEEEVAASARLAAYESLRGGFTTVVDAGTRSGHDLGLIAEQTAEVGARCVLGLTCNDADVDTTTRTRLMARATEHLDRWDGMPLVHPSLAVSIPEAAEDDTLRTLSRMCAEAGVPLQTHVNEHLAGVERSLLSTGERPVERLHRLGALGPQLLAAHATMLTAREMRLFAETGAAISYNPVASAWKGNAVARALELAELGVPLAVGTDGTRGDGFRLLDAAETAQRFAGAMSVGDPAAGSGRLWLHAATAGGAAAVGLSEVTGRLAAGLAADLLIVRTDVPELTPSWDLVWELVRLGNRDLIDAVVVAGRARVVRGVPVGWDADEFLAHAHDVASKAVVRAGLRPPTSGARR